MIRRAANSKAVTASGVVLVAISSACRDFSDLVNRFPHGELACFLVAIAGGVLAAIGRSWLDRRGEPPRSGGGEANG